MRRQLFAAVWLSATFSVGGCAWDTAPARVSRPTSWAVPVQGVAGIANLNRVTPDRYRSEQPSREGLKLLAAGRPLEVNGRAIKTVLSLRALHDDDEAVFEGSTAINQERIHFKTWHPEDEDVIKFLRIATTPGCSPVLVHCAHGSDRTGMMVAVYRIVVQGWTKEDAIDEMMHGDYGFHTIWQNLKRYLEEMNVEAIKAEVARLGPWK